MDWLDAGVKDQYGLMDFPIESCSRVSWADIENEDGIVCRDDGNGYDRTCWSLAIEILLDLP